MKWIELRTKGGDGTTILDLEVCLTIKMSTITARLSDLEDDGLIYKKGEETVQMGKDKYKYSKYYFEPDEMNQQENRQKVKSLKYQKTVKSLLDRFPEFINKRLEFHLQDSLNLQTSLNL